MSLVLRLLAAVAALLLSGALRADAMDRYFQTSDGLRLHYLEAGAGERTIVFIPGWLMPAAVFERQLASLSVHYRVLAFDPRSQGLSDLAPGSHAPEIRMRDLDEFLAAARVDRFILAGWSLGVLESLDYVERRKPKGLAGLILIDNSIGMGTPPKPRSSRFFEDLADPKRRTDFLTNFCTTLFSRPPPETIRAAALESALRVPPATARQLISQPYPRSYWRDIVEAQRVPVLYAVTPRLRRQAEDLASVKSPELATTMVFEQAGHALFVDDAGRFDEAVEAFARRAFGR